MFSPEVKKVNAPSAMRVNLHDIRMALEFVTGPVRDDKDLLKKLEKADGFIARLRNLYVKVRDQSFTTEYHYEFLSIIRVYRHKDKFSNRDGFSAEALCYRSLKNLATLRSLANAPWEVDAEDLTDDGKLRVTEIPRILSMIKESKDRTGRIRKQDAKIGFDVVKGSGSNCGARFRKDESGKTKVSFIYKGSKHSKHIAKGRNGKVKVMMDHETGAWEVLKIPKQKDEEEYKLAQLIKQGLLQIPTPFEYRGDSPSWHLEH